MAYDFYFGKLLLPVAPEKLQMKINNANKTYTLINDGEINVLKSPELTDIEFDLLLPNSEYSFARYKSGFKGAEYFLAKLEKLKANMKKFQFIVTRELPNGTPLFGSNIKVSLESYTIKEDADEGTDVIVSIKLKQYRDYGTKKYKIKSTSSKKKVAAKKTRATSDNAPSEKKYTVKKGDCLWKIAARLLNDGSRWREIYNLNKSVIGGNPNLIYPGQVLTIPEKG